MFRADAFKATRGSNLPFGGTRTDQTDSVVLEVVMTWLRSCAVLTCLLLVPATSFGQDKFFDSNGVNIRYVERGAGEAVVLLHGVGGSLDTSWTQTGRFQELAADYRVIAFDARGHGKSGKPHDPKQYGREMGLDVIRLLDHLGITRAHIVGYSMGGMITSQLLTLHPDPVPDGDTRCWRGAFRLDGRARARI